jgi:hypothetical protein
MRAMTDVKRPSERGVAVVAVLLVLLLISGLGAALAISATTETLMARNHQVAAEAGAVAEAGAAHGVTLTLTHLRGWATQGFASPGAAVTALLRGPDDSVGNAAADADNGSLEDLGVARPPGRVLLAGNPAATYELRVLDDDDPALGRGLSPLDVTRIGEDGEPASDANSVIVVRAVGHAGTTAMRGASGVAGGNAFAGGAAAASGAIAMVEASIGLRRLPAVVTNGPLTVRDNARIGGAAGSVHANGDLALVGTPAISGNASSSGVVSRGGSPVVGGTAAGGREPMPLPPVRAAAYRSQADFVLAASGVVRAADGSIVCDASSTPTACADAGVAWVRDGADGWSLPDSTAPPAGTYYVEGDVSISGSPGTVAVPARLTVVAEGDITVSGDPVLAADAPGLLLVTDGDLLLTGALRVTGEARILVREQAHVAGATALAGQLLVGNEREVGTRVTANLIGGDAAVTFSGAGGATDFAVTAWRRVETR